MEPESSPEFQKQAQASYIPVRDLTVRIASIFENLSLTAGQLPANIICSMFAAIRPPTQWAKRFGVGDVCVELRMVAS